MTQAEADLVAAAQHGAPVADWLEEIVEQETRMAAAVEMRGGAR